MLRPSVLSPWNARQRRRTEPELTGPRFDVGNRNDPRFRAGQDFHRGAVKDLRRARLKVYFDVLKSRVARRLAGGQPCMRLPHLSIVPIYDDVAYLIDGLKRLIVLVGLLPGRTDKDGHFSV